MFVVADDHKRIYTRILSDHIRSVKPVQRGHHLSHLHHRQFRRRRLGLRESTDAFVSLAYPRSDGARRARPMGR